MTGLKDAFSDRNQAKALPTSRPPLQEIELDGNKLSATVNTKAGEDSEAAATDFLISKGLNPEEWRATGYRSSEWTMYGGETGVSTRWSFVRVGSAGSLALPDLDDLHQFVTGEFWKLNPYKPQRAREGISMVCLLADLQVGKVSSRGDTEDLLLRLETSLAKWIDQVIDINPEEIILADVGDILENFENVSTQRGTNDLSITEQLRVARRILWRWIDAASVLAPKVTVITVPSNHGRVRAGGKPVGPTWDDYGIEILNQCADMARLNPEKYGHVKFLTPANGDEAMAVETLCGTRIGFAHGHQVSKIEGLPNWFAGQALGRTAVGSADILCVGHFHNLRVQTMGDDRWLFVAPTADNGSQWYAALTGSESAPGVLSFVVDDGGWHSLHVA